MSKSALICRAGGAALGLALTVSGATAAEPGVIRLGHTTWVGYGPMYLARDLGYFKEAGVDVQLEVIEDAALYMAAAAAGELDGSASTIDEVMKYRSEDFCFKSVYTLDESYGGDGILVPADVNSITDLRGKQVAMNEGSVSQFWFAYLLKKKGMTPADVTISNMTADDAAAAYISKSIPVAVTWEPHLSLVRKSGEGKVLIDSSASPGVIVDVITVSCDIITNRPQDVQAMVSALNKANEYIKTNKDEAYAIMAKGVGGYLTEPADFAESAKGVRFYDAQMNKDYLGTAEKPGPAAELIAMGEEIWTELGHEMKMDMTYDVLVDTTFVNK